MPQIGRALAKNSSKEKYGHDFKIQNGGQSPVQVSRIAVAQTFFKRNGQMCGPNHNLPRISRNLLGSHPTTSTDLNKDALLAKRAGQFSLNQNDYS